MKHTDQPAENCGCRLCTAMLAMAASNEAISGDHNLHPFEHCACEVEIARASLVALFQAEYGIDRGPRWETLQDRSREAFAQLERDMRALAQSLVQQ